MSVTLEPVLNALGYAGETQQVDMVRLLQAAGAYGALPGIDGGLDDEQARIILKNVTFKDTETAVHWLHNAGCARLAAAPENLARIPLVMVDPAAIRTEPGTYQFRADGDCAGVTAKGRIEDDRWDPILHGGEPLLLHERSDGLFVADGHHRLDLATRLNAKGTGPGDIAAMILREADGYSRQDVKIIAAFKNIARLAHGRPDPACMVDAAHALRESRSAGVHQELLPKLNLEKGNLKDADSLSRLGDDSLKMVARNEVPVAMAARVAERVSDNRKQAEVMRIISAQLRQHYNLQPPGYDAHGPQVNSSPLNPADDTARRYNIPAPGTAYADQTLARQKNTSSECVTR